MKTTFKIKGSIYLSEIRFEYDYIQIEILILKNCS